MLKKCRICGDKKFKKIFSMGKQPLANQFYEKKKRIEKYPLELVQCENCTLLQLSYIVPKHKMYDQYYYIPSVSKTNLLYFKTIVDKTIKRLNLKKGSLVIDVGSNDGSLLSYFQKKGMKVMGVDPASNLSMKVKTVIDYFNPETAQTIVKLAGKAKLVTATNVFAHVDNLQEFLEALDILLDENGVFFAQFPDVRNLLSQNQFDTIYHEHLSYFTYEPLHYLFSKSKFELFDITSDNIHGGSMQIWIRRRKPLYDEFVQNVKEIKKELREYLLYQKEKGKKIVGFAAAAKGTVLLNYCGLNNKIIDYVVDGTSYKQGKIIPGTSIPIYPEEKLFEDKPNIILILAWNFKDEIIEKLKGKGFTFVVPIPQVMIIRK